MPRLYKRLNVKPPSPEQLDLMEVLEKETAIREAWKSRKDVLEEREGDRLIRDCIPCSRADIDINPWRYEDK